MKKLLMAAICLCMLFAASAVMANGLSQGYVSADVLNVRAEPHTNSTVLTTLTYGTQIQLGALNDGWYQITLWDGRTAYISADYVSAQPTVSSASPKGAAVVETAKRFLGSPYVYGASGPNAFDCSGFTSYVLRQHGVSVNRSSRDQASNGYAVDRASLESGDLVFFATGGGGISHVGLYIGGGDFIHARSGNGRVSINNLSESYYTKRYVCARRVL